MISKHYFEKELDLKTARYLQNWADQFITTPPVRIEDFNATTDIVQKVICTWTDHGDASSFNIYRDGEILQENVTTPYEDVTIVGEHIYYVVALNVNGSSKSNNSTGYGLGDKTGYPPFYEMLSPLQTWGGYYYMINNEQQPYGAAYYGELRNSDDTGYVPTTIEYPKDGTLDLTGGKKMDTYFPLIDTGMKTVYGIYDVIKGTSYKIYAIEPVSDGIINYYEGDQNTPIALVQSNIPFTTPNTWVITEGKPI